MGGSMTCWLDGHVSGIKESDGRRRPAPLVHREINGHGVVKNRIEGNNRWIRVSPELFCWPSWRLWGLDRLQAQGDGGRSRPGRDTG